MLAGALPGAVLATVVLYDLLSPGDHYRLLVPLLVAVPALAAAAWGMRGTIVFIVLAFGVHTLLACFYERAFVGSQLFQGGLLGLIAISVVSVLPGFLHGRQEQKVRRLRSVAETVQRTVLPPVPAQVDGLRTSAGYRAAHEEARVGGDVYEVLETPYGVRLLIGDAKGKGMAAVEAAANLLGSFREAGYYSPDLPTLVERLEHSVRRHNVRHHGNPHEEFITATIISVSAGPVAEMVCCGHPGPVLLHAGEVTEVHAGLPALPLGLGDLAERGYPVDKLSFDLGDRLLLYTDGVTEARDATGNFYPLLQRAAAWTDSEPDRMIRNLARDLINYTGGNLRDDVALLACERLPSSHDDRTNALAADVARETCR